MGTIQQEAHDIPEDRNNGSWGGSRLQNEDALINSHLENSDRSHYSNGMVAGVGEGVCKTKTMRDFSNQDTGIIIIATITTIIIILSRVSCSPGYP